MIKVRMSDVEFMLLKKAITQKMKELVLLQELYKAEAGQCYLPSIFVDKYSPAINRELL